MKALSAGSKRAVSSAPAAKRSAGGTPRATSGAIRRSAACSSASRSATESRLRQPPSHTTEGLDAARVMREEVPETAIVVLSAHVEVEHAMDILGSGERMGYLLKSRVTDVDEFLETLDRIVKGASVIDPALVRELVA